MAWHEGKRRGSQMDFTLLTKEIRNALGKIKCKTGSVRVHFDQCAVPFLNRGGKATCSHHRSPQDIWSEMELSKSPLCSNRNLGITLIWATSPNQYH